MNLLTVNLNFIPSIIDFILQQMNIVTNDVYKNRYERIWRHL